MKEKIRLFLADEIIEFFNLHAEVNISPAVARIAGQIKNQRYKFICLIKLEMFPKNWNNICNSVESILEYGDLISIGVRSFI